MVVMVGVDVHKDTHCAVAVDEVGRQLGRDRTFRTTDAAACSCCAGRSNRPPTPTRTWWSRSRTAGT
jgi:hypothetical protein